jgi:hypothetical protein
MLIDGLSSLSLYLPNVITAVESVRSFTFVKQTDAYREYYNESVDGGLQATIKSTFRVTANPPTSTGKRSVSLSLKTVVNYDDTGIDGKPYTVFLTFNYNDETPTAVSNFGALASILTYFIASTDISNMASRLAAGEK